MSITDYSTLQSTIIDWLKRLDLSAAVPTFIQLAEAEFNRRLTVKEMEVDTTFAISPGDSVPGFAVLPTGYMEARNMQINLGGGRIQSLEYKTPGMLDKMNPTGSIGLPRYYTVLNNKLQFDKVPDSTYTVEIDYIQQIPALSNSNTTNWLLTKWPDLYIYQALMHSAPYLKNDARVVIWGAILEGDPASPRPGIYDQIKHADQRARWSGSTLNRSPAINPRDGYRRR